MVLRTTGLSTKHMNQVSEPAVPLVLSRITIATTSLSVGANKAHRTPQSTGAFRGTASLSPDEPIPGTRLLQRKITLPRVLRRRLRVRLRYRTWSRRTYLPVSAFGGILTPIALSSAARQTRQCVAFRHTSRFGTDFSRSLRTD
ncbi:hypothetical protein JTE90_013633 [Oedothorax gibbosus]|uniref:Uncharacterized protein n=1 Tax=Oedothorax gibbosus TaxID=931172 RepID=A0AAV6TE11_9ARAC|nr:hypothetical protein JTE90_013633 [Oedothorax gibbosus]